MPDFTIEYMQQCKSGMVSAATSENGKYKIVGLGSERSWPECTCPSYRFGKNGFVMFEGRKVPNPCKHILRHDTLICGWHQLVGPAQTQLQKQQHECPLCGGETIIVKVAV